MRKFLPLQEPIRLQDLLNSAHSRAEKKVKNLSEEHWKLYFTSQRKNQVFVYHVLESLRPTSRVPTFSHLTFLRFSVPACRRPRLLASPRPCVSASHLPASPRPTSPRPRVPPPRVPEYHVLASQVPCPRPTFSHSPVRVLRYSKTKFMLIARTGIVFRKHFLVTFLLVVPCLGD